MTDGGAWPAATVLMERLGFARAEFIGDMRRGRLLRTSHPTTHEPTLVRLARADRFTPASADEFLRDNASAQKAAPDSVLPPLRFGSDGGFLYAVFPDVGALPLSLNPPLAELGLQACLVVARNLVAALTALHDAGCVHGRMDADSVWVDPQSLEVWLSDACSPGTVGTDSPTQLTLDTYEVAPEFAAPEMTGRLDTGIDQRSDLYGVGALLYLLFTGRPPFVSADPLELIHSHLARDVIPAYQLAPQVPRTLSDILNKLLAKMPAARYQSAHGLLYDLEWCVLHLEGGQAGGPLQPGQRDARGVFNLPQALFGRERQVALIVDLAGRVAAGEVHIVFIRGAAGSGKSALARLALSQAGPGGMTVSAKFDQIRRNEPYAFIVQAIAEITQLVLASPEAQVTAWRERLQDALGGNLRLIVDLVPSVQLIVGAQPRLADIPPGEARHRFRLALQAFVRVFCRAALPLRLFLDDLQWADPGSLEMLSSLLSDSGVTNLLLVAAFRDGPDITDTALVRALGALNNAHYPVHELELGDLSLADTADLLARTVDREPQQVLPLAELLQQKTGGNPFFLAQFLRFLHTRRLVRFDYDTGAWQWDVQRIQTDSVTDDVLVLMHRKLDLLPEATRQLLATAALMGAIFELETLAQAAAIKLNALRHTLRPAVDAGLIYRVGSAGAEARDGAPDGVPAPADESGVSYRFVHDQVQQAACGRLGSDEMQRLRLLIGWRLLPETNPDGGAQVPSFAAVDNLNRSAELIHDPQQRTTLAQFNLACGRKARESAAFTQALEYAQAGLRMLGDADAWQSHHALCTSLHAQAFECAYITGQLPEANRLFSSLLDNARLRETKANAYYTRILVATSLDDSQGAIRFGIEGLQLFGHSLSAAPSRVALLLELGRVLVQLRNRSAASLAALATMEQSEARSALRLLVSVCPAAYFQSPNLMCLAALRIMRLSLKHGNAEESPFGYVLFGLIAGALLGRHRLGHEFGQLAVGLARQGQDPLLQAKVIMIFGGFVNYWCDTIDSSLQLLQESLQLAVSAGDVQYANYSILQTLFLSLTRGVPLEQVLAQCKRWESFTNQTKDEFTIANRRLREQFIRALRGETGSPDTLGDAGFDEAALLQHGPASTNRTTLAYLQVVKMQLAFFAGKPAQAYQLSEATERDIEALLGQIIVAEHYFFRGLVIAQLLADPVTQSALLKRQLAQVLKLFQKWVGNCPANFGCQHLLLRAVQANLQASREDAASLFRQAIASATEHRVLYVQGIAAELLARLCFAHGQWNEGRRLIDAAVEAYASWGALAKVRELQATGLAMGASTPAGHAPHNEPSHRAHGADIDRLSFDRFVTSSARLGSVGESHQLFATLMRHVIENAGASAASLVSLMDTQECVVLAYGRSGTNGIDISVATTALAGCSSELLVRYAWRSGQPLAFTSPHSDARFRGCPYLERVQPASVLCVPLHTGPQTVGALYLENALLRDAFVLERMPFLTVLASQLAIVLQNARAFQALAASNRTLDAAKESMGALRRVQSHLTKFVPRSVQEHISAHPDDVDLSAREEDVSVMFLDIAGYTALTELIGSQESQKLVERYFASYLDVFDAEGGEINEIAGDGLMVIFRNADPTEHACRAVAAASAVQACTRRLNQDTAGGQWILVNVGIHCGVATVGAKKIEGKASIRWTFTATGSVTNLAARLVQAAQGGDVLLSEEMASRVRLRHDVVAAGKRQFKGFAQELAVFALGKPAATAGTPLPGAEAGTMHLEIINQGDRHG